MSVPAAFLLNHLRKPVPFGNRSGKLWHLDTLAVNHAWQRTELDAGAGPLSANIVEYVFDELEGEFALQDEMSADMADWVAQTKSDGCQSSKEFAAKSQKAEGLINQMLDVIGAAPSTSFFETWEEQVERLAAHVNRTMQDAANFAAGPLAAFQRVASQVDSHFEAFYNANVEINTLQREKGAAIASDAHLQSQIRDLKTQLEATTQQRHNWQEENENLKKHLDSLRTNSDRDACEKVKTFKDACESLTSTKELLENQLRICNDALAKAHKKVDDQKVLLREQNLVAVSYKEDHEESGRRCEFLEKELSATTQRLRESETRETMLQVEQKGAVKALQKKGQEWQSWAESLQRKLDRSRSLVGPSNIDEARGLSTDPSIEQTIESSRMKEKELNDAKSLAASKDDMISQLLHRLKETEANLAACRSDRDAKNGQILELRSQVAIFNQLALGRAQRQASRASSNARAEPPFASSKFAAYGSNKDLSKAPTKSQPYTSRKGPLQHLTKAPAHLLATVPSIVPTRTHGPEFQQPQRCNRSPSARRSIGAPNAEVESITERLDCPSSPLQTLDSIEQTVQQPPLDPPVPAHVAQVDLEESAPPDLAEEDLGSESPLSNQDEYTGNNGPVSRFIAELVDEAHTVEMASSNDQRPMAPPPFPRRRPGRPPGSKNKKTPGSTGLAPITYPPGPSTSTRLAPDELPTLPKRPIGRPPGSKNKKKQANTEQTPVGNPAGSSISTPFTLQDLSTQERSRKRSQAEAEVEELLQGRRVRSPREYNFRVNMVDMPGTDLPENIRREVEARMDSFDAAIHDRWNVAQWHRGSKASSSKRRCIECRISNMANEFDYGEDFACRRCTVNRMICIVIPTYDAIPCVLPLAQHLRPSSVLEDSGYWRK